MTLGAFHEGNVVLTNSDPGFNLLLQAQGSNSLSWRGVFVLGCKRGLLQYAAGSLAKRADANTLGTPKVPRMKFAFMVRMFGELIALAVRNDLSIRSLTELFDLGNQLVIFYDTRVAW